MYTCPGLGLFLISVSRGQGATLAPLKKKYYFFSVLDAGSAQTIEGGWEENSQTVQRRRNGD